METWERTRWVKRLNANIVRPYYKFGSDKIEGYIIRLENGEEISRAIQHIKRNKTNYQPPSRMTGRDILGRRNSRLQYRMIYKEIEPIVDEEMFKQIRSAWEKIKTPAIGYCTYRDVAEELKMPVGRLMQYLKGMHKQDPYSVRFQVNRMGDNVYFKLFKSKRRI